MGKELTAVEEWLEQRVKQEDQEMHRKAVMSRPQLCDECSFNAEALGLLSMDIQNTPVETEGATGGTPTNLAMELNDFSFKREVNRLRTEADALRGRARQELRQQRDENRVWMNGRSVPGGIGPWPTRVII